MVGFFLLQTVFSLWVILLTAVSGTDEPVVTTSCTTITWEPSRPPSTLTTLPSTSRETTEEAPSEAPTPCECESELEPSPSPSSTVEPPPESQQPPSGPHHITMSLPLPLLPSDPPASPSPSPTHQPPPSPSKSPEPPSSTWRWDPNYYPRPRCRATPKPCNVLNDMAFRKYQHTMNLCYKAKHLPATLTAQGVKPKKLQKEVDKAMHRLIFDENKGYDFRSDCKLSPPQGCCVSVQEMWNAERCSRWWPDRGSLDYWEESSWMDGCTIWQ